jgi:hypothetical protein
MTSAKRGYELAGLRLRVARARLLLQLADGRGDDRLPDLLTFAGQIGGRATADNLAAFFAEQEEELRTAQAELDRLSDPRRPGERIG